MESVGESVAVSLAAARSFTDAWASRLRAHAEGRLGVVAPRRAATVMLLRDTSDGLAVHLLRRRPGMAFAAGMYAYPGGAVDPSDGPEPNEAVCRAAVRETFEEVGVLLAGPRSASDPLPADPAEREALARREFTLDELLDRHGRRLDRELLVPWSRWITPEFEARRYDTHFFAAVLPEGQEPAAAAAGDDTGEADLSLWTTPAAALAAAELGRMAMLPPTLTTLRELAAFGTADAALAAARSRAEAGSSTTPIVPSAAIRADGRLELEWGGRTPGRWSPPQPAPSTAPVPGPDEPRSPR